MLPQEQIKQYIKQNVVVEDNDCWVWKGRVHYDGTPMQTRSQISWQCEQPPIVREWLDSQFTTKATNIALHRLSFTTFVGKPSKEYPYVIHDCKNQRCLNPNHMRVANTTQAPSHRVNNPTKRHRATKEIGGSEMFDIYQKILNNQSFYSIAKEHGLNINNVRSYATTLKHKGYDVRDFQPSWKPKHS